MQIREGGYYKQRNGLIRGPMLIDDDDTVCEVGQVSLLHPTRWDTKGLHIPRIHTKKNDAVDLVEAMAVFPMPELSPRDNTVANDEDGYILEFASDYYADSDDDGLYLFTRGRLLDMLKVRDGYNKRMVSLNLTLDTSEAREDLRKALENLHVDAAKLLPVEPITIKERDLRSFAHRLSNSIIDTIIVHAFENDKDMEIALAPWKTATEKRIQEAVLMFLRNCGAHVDYMAPFSAFDEWHRGGIVSAPRAMEHYVFGERAGETVISREEAKKRGWVTEVMERAQGRIHRAPAETGMSEVTTEEAEDFLGIPRNHPPAPTPGSVWNHRNGNRYAVVMITNAESERQEKYPTSVVYRNIRNGNVYSRKLSDWHRSMTEIGASA